MLTRFPTAAARLVAAALVAMLSGVPQAAWALIAGDCCAERCESERDGRECPPNCPSASCLKAFPVADPQLRSGDADAVERTERGEAGVVAPPLPLVVTGVFQPPRG